MLLKLIPAHTEPTIHFSLSFADLPPGLPTPAAWTAQLAQLMLEDLEVPATLHSLDRAVGVSSLLEEVELDIALGEVRCRFIDGKVESWGFWEGVTSTSISLSGMSTRARSKTIGLLVRESWRRRRRTAEEGRCRSPRRRRGENLARPMARSSDTKSNALSSCKSSPVLGPSLT
ncbi:hypothetical protein CPC08DRAFT_305841 [Agrocybe pediades]|nr:hypothetical protein CPC08DRAFT_305841 [Agrocybe pediades]